MAYRSLGREASARLLRRTFPDLTRTGGAPFASMDGATVTAADGRYAARVRLGDGRTGLAVSSLPLNATAGGALEPLDLTLRRSGRGLVPRRSLAASWLPRRLSLGVRVGRSGVRLAFPRASAADPVQVRGASAVYSRAGRDLDWALSALPSGVRAVAQLRSARSPESIPLLIGMPKGARLVKRASGEVHVRRARRTLAVVRPPTAYDASGARLPARYVVQGRRIVARVKHRGPNTVYPGVLDPVIEDFATGGGWHGNPGLDQEGWEFSNYGSGRFTSARQGTASASFGAPPGRGLYIFAPSRLLLPASDAAGWSWRAPGQTTFITRSEFSHLYFDTPAGAVINPRMKVGIGNDARPTTVASQGIPAGTADGSAVLTTSGREGRTTGFELAGTSAGLLNRQVTAYAGGAVIFLDDPEAPTLATPVLEGTGSAWRRGGTVPVVFTATDPGLGVRGFSVRVPGASGPLERELAVGCMGDRLSRCPATTTQRTTLGIDDLAEGEHELRATAEDPVGHRSAEQPLTVRVDRTGPQLSVEGATDGQLVGEQPLNIQVAASDGSPSARRSGVKSIEVLLDGRSLKRFEQNCPAGSCPLTPADPVTVDVSEEGSHELKVVATDHAGNTTTETLTGHRDTVAPLVALSGALIDAGQAWQKAPSAAVRATATDAGSGVTELEILLDGARIDGAQQDCDPGGCELARGLDVALAGLDDGTHELKAIAKDRAGRTAMATATFRTDHSAPRITLSGPLALRDGMTIDEGGNYALGIDADDGPPGKTGSGVRSLKVLVDGDERDSVEQDCDTGGCTLQRLFTLDAGALEPGMHTVTVQATDGVELVGTKTVSVTVQEQEPTLPALDPPATDLTVATSTDESAEFLYTGDDPAQVGVADDTIDPKRAAIVQVRATDRTARPVPNVAVTILGHPEYGSTVTRADGRAFMAVNGGGALTLDLRKPGFVPLQRQFDAPWQSWTPADDVVLTPFDGAASAIDLTSEATSMQVHEATMSDDGDGKRRAVLMFRPGTTATMVMPDGETRELDGGHVRATELTVGETGPAAMPGDLPATSAYTYAADFSFDEARQAGAVEVRFDRPVINYTDNFLGFPAGTSVPTGYYDTVKGVWVPGRSGAVIEIRAEDEGRARIAVGADEASPDELAELGIDDVELRMLADRFAPGDSFWRVALDHFSTWDHNWGFGPPAGAIGPDGRPIGGKPQDGGCGASGSIIECESQVLGERLPISGTPFTLNYRSDRARGFAAQRTISVPITSQSPPAALEGVSLDVRVAGTSFRKTFSAAPGQSYEYIWDGRDHFGRALQGKQTARVTVGYEYRGSYDQTARFSAPGGRVAITGDRMRQTITLQQTWDVTIGGVDARPLGIGGWTVDVNHLYDPQQRVLLQGDGARRTADPISTGATISSLGGEYTSPRQIAVAPDGSMLFPQHGLRLRRVSAVGQVSDVPGGDLGYSPDSTEANRIFISDVALAPDGSIYVADSGNELVRRVKPDGTATTIAGTSRPFDPCDGGGGTTVRASFGCEFPSARGGKSDESHRFFPFPPPDERPRGDGGPAAEARLDRPSAVAVAPDGRVFIGEDLGIRVVLTDGTIDTYAGGGDFDEGLGDGGPARQAYVKRPADLVVAPRGDLYFGDGYLVRRVTSAGIVERVAGTGTTQDSGDGGPAVDAGLSNVQSMALMEDGALLVATASRVRLIRPGGRIQAFAGDGSTNFHSAARGDGGPAIQALLVPLGLGVLPSGMVAVGDNWYDGKLRLVKPTLPGYDGTEHLIASEQADEAHLFDSRGRLEKTVHTLTNADKYTFDYDRSGRLQRIVDGDDNATTLSHAGNAVTITGPFGQRSRLGLDASGNLATLTNDADESYRMTTGPTGLLRSFTTPAGRTSRFEYDASGRLVADEAPDGGIQTLSRRATPDGAEVTRRSAEGRTTRYDASVDEEGTDARTVTNSAGGQLRRVAEGGYRGTHLSAATGEESTVRNSGDPRFGMQSPFPSTTSFRTRTGQTINQITSREIEGSGSGTPRGADVITETRETDDLQRRTRVDLERREIISTSPENRTRTSTFDRLERPVTMATPGIETLHYTRDAQGRLTELRAGDRRASATFDARGRLAAVTDHDGRDESYTYDAADRLTSETLPGDRTVRYEYDADGKLEELTTPTGERHRFDYDDAGRGARYEPLAPDAGPWASTSTFDRDGLLTATTQPSGRTIRYDRDSAGRLTTLHQDEDRIDLTYTPGTEQVRSVEVAGGQRLSFEYDSPLLKAVRYAGPVTGSYEVEHDARLQVATTRVNGGDPVSYGYDDDGLLVKAGDLTIDRDAANGFVTQAELGRATTVVGIDRYGDLSSRSTRVSSELKHALRLQRDSGGRIMSQEETVAGETTERSFEYDAAGRLHRVRRVGADAATYGYDDNGNRTSVQRAGAPSVSATFDAQDRILTQGTLEFEHDRDGRLTRKHDTNSGAVTKYQYDSSGALLSVRLPDDTVTSYVVDGTGRRLATKRDGDIVQRLLYGSRGGPVADLEADGRVRTRYVYGTNPQVPDYMVRAGTTYRFVTDERGSPRLIIDAETGEVAQRIDYDEFGRVARDTHPGFQPFGFAGGLYDSLTGLVRFGAREYDAEIGRWTAKDPILFAGGDSNLYGYVFADPINLTDPTGLSVFGDAVSAVGDGINAVGNAVGFGCFGSVKVSFGAFDGLGLSFSVEVGPDGVAVSAGGGIGFGGGLGVSYSPMPVSKTGFGYEATGCAGVGTYACIKASNSQSGGKVGFGLGGQATANLQARGTFSLGFDGRPR